MVDLRKQIPIGCSINVAIINELKDHPVFLNACKEVPLKYGITNNENPIWPFYNFSFGAYMMYCLIVVPKEIYKLNITDDFFESLNSQNAFKNFIIHKQKFTTKENIKYNMDSFRNAISHVHYIDQGKTILFWDHYPNKEQETDWHWKVEISYEDLYIFLGIINVENFKFYNEIKEGIRNEDGIK